jgi:hypothetical protein
VVSRTKVYAGAGGYYGPPSLNTKNPRTWKPGVVALACLIYDLDRATPDRIQYRNGDKYDLRRDNVMLQGEPEAPEPRPGPDLSARFGLADAEAVGLIVGALPESSVNPGSFEPEAPPRPVEAKGPTNPEGQYLEVGIERVVGYRVFAGDQVVYEGPSHAAAKAAMLEAVAIVAEKIR